MVAKEEAGQHHLAQPEARAEGREEAHGHDAEQVDKDDGQGRIDEAEVEDGLSQGADGEAGDDHVGR